MIRTLRLSNWRNYEDASLTFEAGTTFVVASNGVGKTSLAEAARWALFGAVSSSSASPVRLGADRAVATVELILPTGQVLTVERTITVKVGRQFVAPTIDLDGSRIGEDELATLLSEAYGTEPSFLARLTMPAVSRDQDVPTALGLENHLGRYFGIDGLHRAVDFLNVELKSNTKQIQQIKNANAASAKQFADLGGAKTVAAAAVASAAAEHNAAQEAQSALRTRLQAQRIKEEWQARQAKWLADSGDLVDEVHGAFDAAQVERSDIEARLEEQVEQSRQTIEDARVQIAIREARVDGIQVNQSRLDDVHDEDCPVCRRPLDEGTVALAHQSNEADLRELAAELAALRAKESTASSRNRQAVDLLQRWRRLALPGPEPEALASPAAGPVDMELAQARVDQALEGLVAARAEQVNADRRLQEARDADDAMKQLQVLFRNEASIRVALQTTQATLDELLLQTIEPLAREVDQRWKALFPDRGELTTHADGSVTRNVNGYDLPYDAFSTGEGMGATIVLRLIVAQMATTADFCWFDEPLEHLDPDVRRQVANILARASDGVGQLRQIVVTTYEEPLARHLQARSPDRVHLIDVRHAPAERLRSSTSPTT